MSTQLAQQLEIRMRAKNLSAIDLEKEARLNSHAVRNILRGTSKKPSAETLQAVSDVLGCTVKDLLAKQTPLQDDDLDNSQDAIMDTECSSLNLLQQTVQFVDAKLVQHAKARRRAPTVRQSLTCVQEI